MKNLIITLAFMLPISLLASSVSESTKNPPTKYPEPCVIISSFKTECNLRLQLAGSIYMLSVCENSSLTTSQIIENIQNHICEFKEFPSYVTVLRIDYETTPFPGGTYL